MSTKKAAKLDMDDRAKIVQYFTRPVNGAGDIAGAVESVRIEDMFGRCWSVPSPGPSLPTVITVQAPAGIGKTSMLKYMCMKWGCQELWTDNFDVLLFVECRTLNRLGPMTGTTKILIAPPKMVFLIKIFHFQVENFLKKCLNRSRISSDQVDTSRIPAKCGTAWTIQMKLLTIPMKKKTSWLNFHVKQPPVEFFSYLMVLTKFMELELWPLSKCQPDIRIVRDNRENPRPWQL